MIRIALALLLTLLVGCPSTADRVLIVGDSISEQSFGALSKIGNQSEQRVTYTSISSYGIGLTGVYNRVASEYWGELIDNSLEGAGFDLVVVQLGTNDCYQVVNGLDYVQPVQEMIANIQSHGVPVVWVEMGNSPKMPTCRAIINGVIGSSGVPVIPYSQWVDANPAYLSDGIHHTESGKAEYAKWLHAMVSRQLLLL